MQTTTCHLSLPPSPLNNEHRVVMFAVTVSWPCTLAHNTTCSFTMNCTHSQMLFFQCHGGFVSLWMDNYTFQEHADIHVILYEPSGNGAETVRMHTERYPNASTFNGTILWFQETSTVGCRRWRSALTVDVEECILWHVEENLHSSIQVQAAKCGANISISGSPRTVVLYPYHLQRVQALSMLDFCKHQGFKKRRITVTIQFMIFTIFLSTRINIKIYKTEL
jgi:hypothetical protein